MMRRVMSWWSSRSDSFRRWVAGLGKALLVLAPAWGAFLWLMGGRPVDAANALIMVWLSVLLLVLTCLPELFALFKRIKWGDFELEIRDTLARASEADLKTIQNIDDRTMFTTKSGIPELTALIKKVSSQTDTPVLMKIGLHGKSVSWAVLYLHVLVLEMLGTSTRLLFLDAGGSRRSKSQADFHPRHVPVSHVLGVLSGQKFLVVCQSRWPELKKALFRRGLSTTRESSFPEGGEIYEFELRALCEKVSHAMREPLSNDLPQSEDPALDRREFQKWLADEVDRSVVDLDLEGIDPRTLEQILRKGSTFLVTASEGEVRSVVALCSLTREVALEALGRARERGRAAS